MQIQLSIEGMSCGHCVSRVRRALQSIEGVEVRSVEVGSAVAEVDPARTKPEDLIRAVDDVGFVATIAATRAA
jgi:copper chaperone CopZ